jgi:uncharacterized cupredoxin-like copper-binding protein
MRYLLAAASFSVLVLGACSGGQAREDDVPIIAIHYSAFEPKTLTIPAGVDVMIELRNEDPIGHEWMVGDEAMHARHRTGTEPYHDSVPTEVSLDPYQTKRTTIRFDRPGTYLYICHLPGHEAYGMVGELHVERR